MSTDLTRLLAKLSRADIERLLAAKDEVESLEARRSELAKELAAVDNKLARLASAALGGSSGARKKTRKKAAKKTAKKAGRKTTKTAVKRGTKKTTRKIAAKAGKQGRQTSSKARPKLDDVVVALIKKNGGPMSFKDIYATIVKRKLVTTRSKQFDNVLRRTLSTSKNVKRVSRGVYGI